VGLWMGKTFGDSSRVGWGEYGGPLSPIVRPCISPRERR